MVNFLFKTILFFMLPAIVLAYSTGGTGLGGVAVNMMEPVTLVSDFVDTGCIVVGIGFLIASIVKYIEHRRSPLMVPISTVIFLLVAGIVLVLMPFLSVFTESGIPYSFF